MNLKDKLLLKLKFTVRIVLQDSIFVLTVENIHSFLQIILGNAQCKIAHIFTI